METTDMQTVMDEYEASCVDLYRSELALHDAHQTHVDTWICAASDRLHEAVVRRERAAAALGAGLASA